MKIKAKRGAKKHFKALLAKYPNDYMLKYCEAVIGKKLVVGEKIYNAVIRQINDLQAMEKDDFPYIFNFKTSENIIRFAKLMPDVSTGEPLPIPLFKGFIFSMIDGWRIKATGGTRFKRIYLSMARTNGKTDIASVLALRDFLFGQPATSRQIIIASNSASQTKQLYGYIRLRWNKARQLPIFSGMKSQVTSNQLEMRMESQNTRLWKLTAGGEGADSAHPTLAIFDEYHEQTDTSFLDTITSGNVQNKDARLIIISTAGVNPLVPMHRDYDDYTEKLERGELSDRILFLCWEQDDDNEVYKPDVWEKSNPLMEVADIKETLVDGIMTERNNKISEGELPRFIVKNMNRWQNAKTDAFLPLEVIEDAQTATEDLPSIKGRDVYVGFDFSMKEDDTAIAFVYPIGNERFMVQQFSFIPTNRAGGINNKMKRDGINYVFMEKKGWCKVTDDQHGFINQGAVYDWFLKYVEDNELNVKAVGYDSWQAQTFAHSLELHQQDWNLFPIPQTSRTLSEPTKFLQRGITDGSIIIPKDDEILKTCLSNAVLLGSNNMILIDKNRGTAKIDCVDAIIDALYEGMYHYEDYTQASKTKDILASMTDEEKANFYHNYFG